MDWSYALVVLVFACLGVGFFSQKAMRRLPLLFFNCCVFQRELLAFTFYGEGKRQNYSRNEVKLRAK